MVTSSQHDTPTASPITEEGSSSRQDGTAGRPVAIDLGPKLDEPIRRWTEGVLGWQVVDTLTGRLVPPTAHLLGIDADPPDDGVPRILVLEEASEPEAIVAACQRLRPTAGLTWPRQRDDLLALVSRVVAFPPDRQVDRRILRIGGVAGGVGTTTVALALAGLAGWQDRRTLAAVRGDAPAAGAPVVTSEAIAATDLWSRVPALPGVPAARVVRVSDPSRLTEPRDPAIEFAVLDHGVDVDTDVVVCRPDAAALEQLPATTAAAVVVVGAGPLRVQDLREAAGGRPAILLPWSSRVARAGLRRRVPASLPGSWLRRLRPLLPDAGRSHPIRARGTRDDPNRTTADPRATSSPP
jgi:hypothetical protein